MIPRPPYLGTPFGAMSFGGIRLIAAPEVSSDGWQWEDDTPIAWEDDTQIEHEP